jgi:hypothetical protein
VVILISIVAFGLGGSDYSRVVCHAISTAHPRQRGILDFSEAIRGTVDLEYSEWEEEDL